MKKFPLLLSVLLISFFTRAQQSYLLAGTYTGSSSKGIYVYEFDAATGELRFISSVSTSNPSYLAISPTEKYVYAVNEDQPGHISSYRFDKKTGELHFLNEVASAGDHPCYIAVHPSGKWVVSGNYSSGNFSVFKVTNDGALETTHQSIRHKGKSINAERQTGPHVHATVFSKNGETLFVPDLGLDKVFLYHFNELTGTVSETPSSSITVNPGNGPRHIELSKNQQFAYLAEEMSGSVSVWKHNNQSWKKVQQLSSHPSAFKGFKGSADIHLSPDGRFLYMSNRGDANNIAIFSVNPKTGLLTISGFQPTLGTKPRNFTIDPAGNFLLVANQNSDNIVIFRINKKTGLLTPLPLQLSIPQPVCLKWISL